MATIIEKKTFYGEYTLFHWIELILKKNILLPEYQRSFVWEKGQVENFLKRIKDGIFVPPVIIGSLEKNDGSENIILDGQQRLTSILLGYLGIYPKPEAFKISDDPLYSSADDSEDEEGDDSPIIEWSFKILTNDPNNNSKANILAHINAAKYDLLAADSKLDDAFLNENFLGFSYIVPIQAPVKKQQRFYSTVFHDINQQGVALQGQESRRSLYYLNSELVPFFEPSQVTILLKLIQNGKTRRYDYVRLLAFLAQYNKQGNENSIAKKCRSQELFELYYEKFINAVVTDEDSSLFGKFSSCVSVANIEARNNRLKEYIEKLHFYNTFSGIIEADTKLAGLVYFIVFKDKCLDETRFDELKAKLDEKINQFKGDPNHRSSGLTYIRSRIKESIAIYNNYVV